MFDKYQQNLWQLHSDLDNQVELGFALVSHARSLAYSRRVLPAAGYVCEMGSRGRDGDVGMCVCVWMWVDEDGDWSVWMWVKVCMKGLRACVSIVNVEGWRQKCAISFPVLLALIP